VSQSMPRKKEDDEIVHLQASANQGPVLGRRPWETGVQPETQASIRSKISTARCV
jgi:hypothetical protein